ncbi:MAG: hypothetical protein K2X69_13520 [Silvanigrellaceae bacterium]|nr:hypothetical protein [Silvanigrellaceae bacterium]
MQEDDVYKSFGFCYKNEVYYVLNRNVPVEMVYKCLTYSSAIWHSLSVITKVQPEMFENKELNEDAFGKICQETVLIMLSAYDGEGYVFWRKR